MGRRQQASRSPPPRRATRALKRGHLRRRAEEERMDFTETPFGDGHSAVARNASSLPFSASVDPA
jgi:hypothetical protein